MSWRSITESDVVTQISSAELEALRQVVLADDQVDPVQPSIDAITSRVRGYVAGNPKNDLDEDTTTIPDRLISSAVSLIVVLIMSRATIEPNATRQKLADQAETLLRSVAKGEFSIADPVTGTESTGGGATVIGSRTPRVTRANMGGM